ncbi:alpha/beta hydrolase [uncultured Desulfobulbus sp.]|uniref:alpha/beta fold hydrolase n=1 Tax=uncultured Desulfobulbus sp. TaxID=239745 RepID=UPI0029C944BA|nr:alpha/beta hydrolase [uncultured Desulfobulbus sp.]
MLEITSKIVNLDDCVVHCLECGEAKGRAVVLLHGMKFQAETWRELGTLEVLAGLGLHVLAVDMPGFGKSPASETLPVEVLAQFVRQQGLDRVVLVGPSMGGRIALEFAIKYPQWIAGLILAGAVGVEENRAGLTGIAAPTHIVWGAKDQISPLANSDTLLAEIQNATREIYPEAPHPCYLVQPDRWHASLRTFFTNLNT